MKSGPLIAGFAAMTLAAALIGGAVGPDAWFAALAKPSWNPPGWVFGPVWTTLYVLIAWAGVEGYRRHPWRRATVALWVSQMVLNGAWSPTFFGAHRPDLALLVILLLWGTIIGYIAWCWQKAPRAARLFLPYLAWVTFASALNASIWWLNR